MLKKLIKNTLSILIATLMLTNNLVAELPTQFNLQSLNINNNVEASIASNIHFQNLMNLTFVNPQNIIAESQSQSGSEIETYLNTNQVAILDELKLLLEDFPVLTTLDENSLKTTITQAGIIKGVTVLAHMPGGPKIILNGDGDLGGGASEPIGNGGGGAIPCKDNLKGYENCGLTAWGSYIAVLAGCTTIVAPPMVIICMTGASVAYIGAIYSCKSQFLCP